MVLPVYMLFVLGAAIAAFVVLVIYHREPAKKVVLCPEARMPTEVEVDRLHALLTLLKNEEELKLKSCSRWPERAGCDEDCLAQLEFGPRTERVLGKWCEGKNCAICATPINRTDWQRGRAGVIDAKHELVELHEMDWKQFPMILERYQPLCWNCHESELEKRRERRETMQLIS